MPFCYAEAAANLLTIPALDPFGKIPEFKFCAVRAGKVEIRTAADSRIIRAASVDPSTRLGGTVTFTSYSPRSAATGSA